METSHQNILSMPLSKDLFGFLQLTELGAIYSVNPDMKTNKSLTFFINEQVDLVFAAYAMIQKYIENVENDSDQMYAFINNKPPKIQTFLLAKYYYDINKSDTIKEGLVKALNYAEYDEMYPRWYYQFVNSFN